MKKLFSKLASLSLALTLGVGALSFPVNTASAADDTDAPVETPVTDTTFKMAEGASVRVTPPAGIRFRVEIGADLVDTVKAAYDFGFLVFPQEYLATAVANVTAGTAASYHVKADQNGDGEVSEEEYAATTYGLYDYVEVKKSEITDWNWDTAIYTENGTKYVNGVLGDIGENNLTKEFAAIAWYQAEENGAYTYADFNADFSRSITYVAQQAYIAGAYSKAGLTSRFTWLKESDFEIRSGADMTELSNAVAAAKAEAEKPTEEQNENILLGDFEGINFKLTKAIAVGSGYEPVPDNFKGTFSYNGWELLMIGTACDKPFAIEEAEGEEVYNVAATKGTYRWTKGYKKLSTKLFDASAATAALGDITADAYEIVDAPANTDGLTGTEEHYTTYTGKAVKVTYPGNNKYVSLPTDWCFPDKNSGRPEEIAVAFNFAKELGYTTIKFRLYVANTDTVTTTLRGSTSFDAFIAKILDPDTGAAYTNKNPFPVGYWMEFSFDIDTFYEYMYNRNGNNSLKGAYRLPLGRLSGNEGGLIYFGDCVIE